MLDHPKWLLFAIFSFAFIHVLINVLEAGQLGTAPVPTGEYDPFTFVSTVKDALFYDYTLFEGNLIPLKTVLTILQWTFIALIGRDILNWIRGV